VGRDFDVVIWGATGFTGELVAQYFARHRPEGLRWAIAGRNQTKLENIRAGLCEIDDTLGELELLTGDSHDAASLDVIAARATVVVSTVGPFAKYGSELVAACVKNGTHYCDITGESHWVRRMIDAHHDEARKTGARIVHCCGFDSIPSDIGCQLLQLEARKQQGAPCSRTTLYVDRVKGAMSGGTLATMGNLMEEATRDRSIRRILGDPYALNPEGERHGPDGADQTGIGREPGGGWTAPFVMAAINTRIVRRSNALMGYPYGKDFRYQELMRFPPGAKGLMMATALTGSLATFTALMVAGPTRRLLSKTVLPKPGSGPSRHDRENGFYRLRLVGSGGPRDIVVRVEGDADPGYGDTAKMIGQSALCLALDGDALESEGGVLTPASAMGSVLLERLRGAGMRFDVA
jgi:short subunit dehydrogenase-like uncharacterized protein